MKKNATVFLQAVVVLIGVAALAFLLWEPTVEGANADATTLSQIYFDDPFLACAYLASIAFFVALHRAFKVFGYAGRGAASSPDSLKALRTIRNCMLFLVGLLAMAQAYLFIAVRGKDDIAGGVAMSLLLMLIFGASAAAASAYERALRRAAVPKSGNVTV
jgi:hypothetical protein